MSKQKKTAKNLLIMMETSNYSNEPLSTTTTTTTNSDAYTLEKEISRLKIQLDEEREYRILCEKELETKQQQIEKMNELQKNMKEHLKK